jgi:membrane protein implicated in regulation of membrane protease activity
MQREGEAAMPWWGWIVVGVLLLGGEMVADAQFYLVFLGVAAVVTGLLGFGGISGGIAMQWAIFGALSLILLIAFRARVYGRLRGTQAPGHETIVGEVAVVTALLPPGAVGRAELRGTSWSARNVGVQPIAAGERAQVVRVQGLVIDVRLGE